MHKEDVVHIQWNISHPLKKKNEILPFVTSVQFSSVQWFGRVRLFATPWATARQASLSFTVPWSCRNSCSLSWWCHPSISSSVASFSSCPQSFPASGTFPVSWLFASGGQSIGVSASVLPMNIQDWFPLGWTGWISLQSKRFSRVFSNTTVQKHQIFGTQLSFFFFYFIFKLYIIVLVLPNIKMNPPQVYMCSPSWTLLLSL